MDGEWKERERDNHFVGWAETSDNFRDCFQFNQCKEAKMLSTPWMFNFAI
jgi:hypothetical protein